MRTTIAIDDELIGQLMRAEGDVSRSEAIRRAIEDYLKRKRLDEFLTLAGSELTDLGWREGEEREMRKIRRHGRKR
jgi:Arc/MetJ family transcription regulator